MRLSLRWVVLGLIAMGTSAGLADDPSQDPQKTPRKLGDLEDPPATFVPLHPRTTEQRDQVEALRLFASARASEDRHKLTDALDLLEQARKLSPNNSSILRRLSRINLLLGRGDQAVAVAKQLIDVDPGDSMTLSLLVSHYLERKNDPVAAEALLRRVGSNPKLDKSSPGYYLVQRDLGDINADLLNKPNEAADAYAKLMDALDDRAANNLSPQDLARILQGSEPPAHADAYVKFGDTFLKAKRFDDAIRAFRRGLIYKADHAVLPRLLAESLFKSGKAEDALAVLEPFLKKQPIGSEPYELLADLLTSLGRDKEILPRLEEAVAADAQNLRLQFALAARLRVEGQVEKADALLAELLKNQAEPQVYAELAKSYLKEKRFEDLLRVLGDAIQKPNGFDSVKPTIDAISEDREATASALDAAIAMQEADPVRLTESSRKIVAFLAGKAKLFDKLVRVDRGVVKSDPSAANYRELAFDLRNAAKHDESVEAIQELMAKFPAERNPATLFLLAQGYFLAGKMDEAIASAREAEKLQPDDRETLKLLAFLLGQVGKDDDAIVVYEGLLKRFPDDDEITKRVRQGLSSIYGNKGDHPKAEAELEILLQKYPEDPGVNNDLGYLYAEQGKNLEKAEAMIRKALEDEPDNTSYLDSLGWVLFKRDKPKDALLPLEQAAQKAEEKGALDVTICEHLGDVLFRLQEYPRAKEFWRKAEGFAVKPSPPNKRLIEIKKKLVELEKLGPAPKPSGAEGP